MSQGGGSRNSSQGQGSKKVRGVSNPRDYYFGSLPGTERKVANGANQNIKWVGNEKRRLIGDWQQGGESECPVVHLQQGCMKVSDFT